MGLPEDRCLGNDDKTSNITLTGWVNSLKGYLKERGLDTALHIFDTVGNTEVYLIKDWGLVKPYRIAAWENLVLTGILGATFFDCDVDNLKWCGKSIMNSISLDIWDSNEKNWELGITYLLTMQPLSQRFSKSNFP